MITSTALALFALGIVLGVLLGAGLAAAEGRIR